jgi:outer membrane protein assembly factor BamB
MSQTRRVSWTFVMGLAAAACGGDSGGGPSGGATALPTGATGAAATTGGANPMGGGGTTGGMMVNPVGGGGAAVGGAAGAPPLGGAAGTGTGGMGGGGDGATWPMMGYDERNWYMNPNETTISVANAGMLVEKWRFTTAGMPPGTPIIAEGKAFVMASGGSYAINLADGTKAWERLDIKGTASMAYEGGFVFAHANDAKLFKLKASDGMNAWGPVATNSVMGCTGMSSPILGGGKVMVGRECGPLEIAFGAAGQKGGVAAFNIADGAPAWTYDTVAGGEDGAMVWSSVGIDVAAGTVFAATGNNYTMGGANSDAMHAIDLNGGTKKWVKQVRPGDTWSLFGAPTGPDTDFGANPIVTDNSVSAGTKDSVFWNLDKAGGNVNWSRDMLSPSRDAAHGGILMNGAFDGTNYYAICNDALGNASLLHAMAAAGGAAAWPPKTFPTHTWGAPSVANGVLYVPVNDELVLFDAGNGTELKRFTTGGTIAAGAAAVAGGVIVVGSGMMYSLGGISVKPGTSVVAFGLP